MNFFIGATPCLHLTTQAQSRLLLLFSHQRPDLP